MMVRSAINPSQTTIYYFATEPTVMLSAGTAGDHGRVSERNNSGFQQPSDFVRGDTRRKYDRRADAYGDFAEAGEPAAFALHLPDTVETHGDDGKAEILGQQADAALEWRHAAVFGVVDHAFGENQDAIPTVGGLAGKTE